MSSTDKFCPGVLAPRLSECSSSASGLLMCEALDVIMSLGVPGELGPWVPLGAAMRDSAIVPAT